MGYKEDLRKINAVLRDPNSRCYDPLAGKSPINIQERKVANLRRLKRTRSVMKWRRRNRIKYRAYMRQYMAERRAARKANADPQVANLGGTEETLSGKFQVTR